MHDIYIYIHIYIYIYIYVYMHMDIFVFKEARTCSLKSDILNFLSSPVTVSVSCGRQMMSYTGVNTYLYIHI